MSHPHPTISAWTRDEHDGRYQCEQQGWSLQVSWAPPAAHANRGSFHWQASRDDEMHAGHDGYAEMEDAMGDAEQFVRVREARRAAAVAAQAERASVG
jgi:hypothetical protein